MTTPTSDPSAFERKVAERFGLLPHFFSSAPDAPEIVEKLWGFAKSAYLDNPIPSLFKERLFVYLSRFCMVRYCITRHCAFLVGYGYPAGDPTAVPQTIEQAIRLLKTPPPWERGVETVLSQLEAGPAGAEWPAAETAFEDHLFSAATLVFVEPARADRARQALRRALGGRRFEHLMGLLAFIRTAHYWTVLHPDLANEDDVRELLSANEELARVLLQDPEAARYEMGTRLFAELEGLRGLHERRELEMATLALEVLVEQKENLLKEANHRVKNSLQIVASLLHLQLPHTGSAEAAEALRSAAARVLAIAAVHERLYTGDDIQVVPLQRFLGDLCQEIGRGLGCPDGIQADVDAVEVPTDMAVPLALIVNELVTNVIKHVGPPCRIVIRKGPRNTLSLSVSDAGPGPPEEQPHAGMGSRIVRAFATQLGARMETKRGPDGYTVVFLIPIPEKP